VNLLPGWAPNVHPLIVHFPIGLLLTAAGVDAAAWLLRCNQRLRFVASSLYVGGTAMLIAAYFTGRAAAGSVFLSGMAHAAIKQHWDMAFLTVWFFGALTVIRLLLLRWLGPAPRSAAVGALVLAGFIGVALIGATGDRGGRLVYEYSVGVVQK
jgi:uncharacterized membrane protein